MTTGTTGNLKPESFNNFGELLRYLRERAELSQRELALQVGYHYSYMSRIEKNERLPDSATLMARFVPALGLDNEPRWTERLLRLAASEEKTVAPRRGGGTSVSRPQAVAPALPIFDNPHSPLPLSLTPLLGREQEVDSITALLARPNVRLVTLVGAPGVGKTRLAIHIANEVAGMFAHGAVFADLSTVSEPRDVLAELANALGVHGSSSDAPLSSQLIGALKQKNLLLVIDNLEHVLDASPQIVQLLANTTQIKALVTSREALRVSGEHEFAVKPLPVPEQGQNQSGQLIDYAAVQLFAQRAQAVDPGFQLTLDNLKSISEICRRLDGLPLAIELAAARVKFLTPQAMLAQFDRRLDWVAQGTRDTVASRKTLRGAIEWSYNALSEAERVLMRRLAAFSGGWNAGSAEAVCGESEAQPNPRLKRGEVLNMLIQLTDKSLVLAEKQEQETRFRFLETIHEFAREKLEGAGEGAEIRNRHLAYFAEYAEMLERNLDTSDQVKWTILGDQEHNNIRAALDWGLHEGASFQDALRIAAATGVFWIARSFFREGFERVSAYLPRASQPEHAPLRVKLLYRGGAMAGYLFDYVTGRKLCAQGVELARTLGSKRDLASALFYLSEIALNLGQTAEAHALLDECISLCWQENYPSQLGVALTNLGIVLDKEGDLAGARSTLEEALAISSRAGDIWGVSHALHNLGVIHRLHQDFDEASACMERSLEVSRTIGDRQMQTMTLANLSIFHNLRGDYQKSEDCAEQAFTLCQEIGDENQKPFPLRMMGYAAIHAGNIVRARVLMRESLIGNHGLADPAGQLACLIGMANCDLAEQDLKGAVTLCALAEKHRGDGQFDLLEPDAAALESILKQCKRKLGKAEYESAYKKGQSLKLDNLLMQLMAE